MKTPHNIFFGRQETTEKVTFPENTYKSHHYQELKIAIVRQKIILTKSSKIIIEPPHSRDLKTSWENVLHDIKDGTILSLNNFHLLISKHTNTKNRTTHEVIDIVGYKDVLFEANKSGVPYTFQEDPTQIQSTIDFILTSHYQHEVQDTIIT